MKEYVDHPSFGGAIADLAGRVGTQERVDDPAPVRYRFEIVGSAAIDANTTAAGDLRSTPWMPPVDVVFDELWVVYGTADTTDQTTWWLERSGTAIESVTLSSGAEFSFSRFTSPQLFTPMHRLTFYLSNSGFDWLDATVMARGWSPVPFIGSGGLDFRLTPGGM